MSDAVDSRDENISEGMEDDSASCKAIINS